MQETRDINDANVFIWMTFWQLSEGVRERREEGQISYFVFMHVLNEYVFHVNAAHTAYCNGLG